MFIWVRVVIGLVCFDCIFIPFTCENATATSQLKTPSDATYSRKQIYKIKIVIWVIQRRLREKLLQRFKLAVT